MSGGERHEGRYTISRHDAPDGVHWDLFLEDGATLSTWRLSAPPESGVVASEAISDHRTRYLDYDGEVGGGRGVVTRHSWGRYRTEEHRLLLEGGPSAGAYRWLDGRTLLRPVACQGLDEADKKLGKQEI